MVLMVASARATYNHIRRISNRPCQWCPWCEAYGSWHIFNMIIATQMVIMLLLLLLLQTLLLLRSARRSGGLIVIVIIATQRHGVQNVHTHRALLLDDEPLVYAVVVEVVVAWLEHLYQLMVRYDIKTDSTIVNLDL
jgi:hypothetical protein